MGKISAKRKAKMSGIILVTLPIGNIEDITTRALNTLKDVQYIFAEDTRVLKKLLSDLGVSYENKNINSFHDHSEDHKLNNLIKIARENTIAIVSDAGSPIISDPAFPIVQASLKEGIKLDSASGVSAVTYALELSGLAPTPFHFHGFIARESSKKNEAIDLFSSQYGTHIFFEGVSRVIKTLEELCAKFKDNDIVVARELSKDFQSVYRFKGSEFDSIKDSIVQKGEFVILINNPSKAIAKSPKLESLAQEIISKGAKPKLVAKLLGEITGDNSKDLYEKIKKS